MQQSCFCNTAKSFPGGSVVKNPPANAGHAASIPGSGRPPGERNGNTFPVFLPGKSHGQGSLEGHSPWITKELDITQLLNNMHHLYSTTNIFLYLLQHVSVHLSILLFPHPSVYGSILIMFERHFILSFKQEKLSENKFYWLSSLQQ